VRLHTVECGNAVELGSECELGVEGGELGFDRGGVAAAEQGAVDADFADLGAWICQEACAKLSEPVTWGVGAIPRVEPVAGDKVGARFGSVRCAGINFG